MDSKEINEGRINIYIELIYRLVDALVVVTPNTVCIDFRNEMFSL